MDVLSYIKRLVIRGSMRFTEKARDELETDDLTANDIAESIVNADEIYKVIRSRHPQHSGEKLYVIKSTNFEGTCIYTKGAIRRLEEREVFYVFISSKIDRARWD